MNGSFNFLTHLIGFSLLSGLMFSGFVLNRRFASEKDPAIRMYLGGIMRKLGMLSPIPAAILLVTGIGNIHNLYMESPDPWYTFGWLVAKIIVFAIMLVNGTFLGPALGKKRMMLVKAIVEKTAPDNAEEQIAGYNRQMSTFYLVQFLFLLAILYLTTFGTGKHPGMF